MSRSLKLAEVSVDRLQSLVDVVVFAHAAGSSSIVTICYVLLAWANSPIASGASVLPSCSDGMRPWLATSGLQDVLASGF